MSAPATLSATDRFAFIIDGLCAAVAARIAARTITGVLISLIWGRLRRINRDFQALAARIRAGALVTRRPRSGPGNPRASGPRPAPLAPPSRLPRQFGWLIELVPCHAACFAEGLRGLLADPEMAALIAATPRMRRLLRPLCHMLLLEPALLGPPPIRPAPTMAVPPEEARPEQVSATRASATPAPRALVVRPVSMRRVDPPPLRRPPRFLSPREA